MHGQIQNTLNVNGPDLKWEIKNLWSSYNCLLLIGNYVFLKYKKYIDYQKWKRSKTLYIITSSYSDIRWSRWQKKRVVRTIIPHRSKKGAVAQEHTWIGTLKVPVNEPQITGRQTQLNWERQTYIYSQRHILDSTCQKQVQQVGLWEVNVSWSLWLHQ